MRDKLKAILEQSLSEVMEKPVSISDETMLRKNLHLTSIDILDLLFTLEKRLNVKIQTQEFFKSMAENLPDRDCSTKSLIDLMAQFEKPLP